MSWQVIDPRVEIDTIKLEKWLLDMRDSGVPTTQIAENIGRSPQFFGNSIASGAMSAPAYRLLCRTYGLPHDAFWTGCYVGKDGMRKTELDIERRKATLRQKVSERYHRRKENKA